MQKERVIAKVFRYVRHRARLDQRRMAKLLGVHQSTISKIECGRHQPQPSLLRRMLQYAQLSYSELVKRSTQSTTV